LGGKGGQYIYIYIYNTYIINLFGKYRCVPKIASLEAQDESSQIALKSFVVNLKFNSLEARKQFGL